MSILLSPQLQAFVAVARAGTVHAAANSLALTQTGVTQRLRSLETQLNTSLFIRSRRGMQLTTEGEALLRYCERATELEGEAISQIQGRDKEESVAVTISGPTSIMSSRIVTACSSLYEQWPFLLLHFSITDHADTLHLLRTAQTTFAIVSPEKVPNEMDSKVLKPDRYVLVASAKWKHRRFSDILLNERIIDFDVNDSTSLNYLRYFSLESKLTAQRLFVNNNEALIKLFSCGVGYGTLTQEIAAPYLQSGQLITLNSGQAFEDAQALVWYPRVHMPAYFKAIIKAIR